MSIRYRKVQNKISGSKSEGKWFAKAVSLSTVDTKQLAEEISHSTTVTRADIMAVIIELVQVMKNHLLNSDKVQVDGLGSFSVGIKSKAADAIEDVNANKITGYRVNFAPEKTFTATGVNDAGNRTGFFTKELLRGASAKELTVSNGSASDSTDQGNSGN